MCDGSKLATGQRWGPAVVGLTVYAALAAALLHAEADRLSLDLTKYVQVGLCLAEGNFTEGISTYWGPLLSWAIAGFYRVGVDPVYGAKAVLLAAGGLYLAGIDVLARVRMGVSAWWRLAVAVGIAPAVARAAVLDLTPDILLAALLTMYLVCALDPRLADRKRVPLLAGILGGAGTLAKAYALPFFAVHWTTVCGLRALQRGPARALIRSWSAGVLACLAVAGPYVAIISLQAGRPILSEAGWQARMLATHGEAFAALRERAVSDRLPRPGLLVTDVDHLSPPETKDLGPPTTLLPAVVSGAMEIARILRRTDALGLGWVCLVVAPLVAKGRDRAPWILLVLAVAVYAGGYMPLYVESRYLMPFAKGLAAVALTFVAGSLTRRLRRGRAWASGLTGLLAVAILCAPDLLALTADIGAHQGAHPWRTIQRSVARHNLPVATIVSDDRRVAAFSAITLRRPGYVQKHAPWNECLPALHQRGGILAVLRDPNQARRLAARHRARLVGAFWRVDPYTPGEPIWVLYIP